MILTINGLQFDVLHGYDRYVTYMGPSDHQYNTDDVYYLLRCSVDARSGIRMNVSFLFLPVHAFAALRKLTARVVRVSAIRLVGTVLNTC